MLHILECYPLRYFNNLYSIYGEDKLIKRSQLKIKDKISNKSLMENNKFVFGVYYQIYPYNKGI